VYERACREDSREIARNGGAMISSEVQRTLVKSPPELWAEISDPQSLARHLGEFGEIRITRVQPEQKVEWEAGDASGTVVIKPSGWGTKVKLTVTRELAEAAVEDAAAEPASGEALEQAGEEPALHLEGTPESQRDTERTYDDEHPPEGERVHGAALEGETAGADPYAPIERDAEALDDDLPDELPLELEAEPIAEPPPEPEPRRGFFARLFGRRRARAEQPDPVSLVEPEPEPIGSEPGSEGPDMLEHDRELDEGAAEHGPALTDGLAEGPSEATEGILGEQPAQPATEASPAPLDADKGSVVATEQPPAPDDAAERTKLAEEIAAEEVTAVLTGVLDRLGAAHHRPFSRA
jgi:hypothetical protein